MAIISEDKKSGKRVSCCALVCPGREVKKRQIRRFMAWTPLEGMTSNIYGQSVKRKRANRGPQNIGAIIAERLE